MIGSDAQRDPAYPPDHFLIYLIVHLPTSNRASLNLAVSLNPWSPASLVALWWVPRLGSVENYFIEPVSIRPPRDP
jgi:hypothetical protein